MKGVSPCSSFVSLVSTCSLALPVRDRFGTTSGSRRTNSSSICRWFDARMDATAWLDGDQRGASASSMSTRRYSGDVLPMITSGG